MSNCRPLYKKYPTQLDCQPAYLEIDKNGSVSVDYCEEIGYSRPADVFNGSRLRFAVSPHLSQVEIDELMQEVKPFAAELHKTAPIDWDDRRGAMTRTKSEHFYKLCDVINGLCIQYAGDDEPCYSEDCEFCSEHND